MDEETRKGLQEINAVFTRALLPQPTRQPPKKATCPYCGQRVTLTPTGKLRAHIDRSIGKKCGRSGGRPN
jgi:hypothetical protein